MVEDPCGMERKQKEDAENPKPINIVLTHVPQLDDEPQEILLSLALESR